MKISIPMDQSKSRKLNVVQAKTLLMRMKLVWVSSRCRGHLFSNRHALKVMALTIAAGSISSMTIANDRVVTGVFEGTGRACSGALYVRAKTIQWNSTYSICTLTRYEILEKNLDGDHERIVFHLKKRSRQCLFEIVEVEHVEGYSWNVNGYPSLEGFQKRNLPDWNNSPLPERQILSCVMTR